MSFPLSIINITYGFYVTRLPSSSNTLWKEKKITTLRVLFSFCRFRLLCENGCDVNARTLSGETALHVAVSQVEFNVEMINLLLSNGCNASIQDNLGRQTALHMLIKKHVASPTRKLNNDVEEVFRTLAKSTDDVNIADRRLRIPLHCVASYRNTNLKLMQVRDERSCTLYFENSVYRSRSRYYRSFPGCDDRAVA